MTKIAPNHMGKLQHMQAPSNSPIQTNTNIQDCRRTDMITGDNTTLQGSDENTGREDNPKKLRWQPAIYEHKAALIGQPPAKVSRSAELLVEAVLKEYETYQADYITVGLDVYNIEAEALGAQVIVPNAQACPDLAGPIYDLDALPAKLVVPDILANGRFGLMLDAGQRARNSLGSQTQVRVAASGPVTLAAKLAGLEPLIMSLCMEDGLALRLLDFATRVVHTWCHCLREHGLDAIVFDSMAAPPMFSPALYEQHVLPLHRRLMDQLKASGQSERELVIGGNTAPIAAQLTQTGATILLCDYATDAGAFKAGLGNDTNVTIRRNISPARLATESSELLAEEFTCDLTTFTNPIAGTGILPYDFAPEDYLHFQHTVNRNL
jgi:uroporphyrinogen decarboxylase